LTENVAFDLYNLTGQLIKSGISENQKIFFSSSAITNGLYVLKLQTAVGETETVSLGIY